MPLLPKARPQEFHARRVQRATIDHIIPRRKHGSNDRANLALACRACNHAKGDRDLADFLANPNIQNVKKRKRVAERRRVTHVATPPRPQEPKPMRGTLAHAIMTGEVLPHGVYRRVRPNDAPESRVRIARPPMTALETARWLREQAEKKGKPWPLA